MAPRDFNPDTPDADKTPAERKYVRQAKVQRDALLFAIQSLQDDVRLIDRGYEPLGRWRSLLLDLVAGHIKLGIRAELVRDEPSFATEKGA